MEEEVDRATAARKFFSTLDTLYPALSYGCLVTHRRYFSPCDAGEMHQSAFRERLCDLKRSVVVTDGQSGQEWRVDICIMMRRGSHQSIARELFWTVFTATRWSAKGKKANEVYKRRILWKSQRRVLLFNRVEWNVWAKILVYDLRLTDLLATISVSILKFDMHKRRDCCKVVPSKIYFKLCAWKHMKDISYFWIFNLSY